MPGVGNGAVPDASTPVDGRSAPLRCALAGYGYWGVNLARNLAQSPATELAVVAEPDPASAARSRSDHPSVPVVDYLDHVLPDVTIEAVVVATPASMHEDHALAVIAAGKHVLVEKPLALDVAGAERVRAAADRAGVCVLVGHTFLYSPPIERLAALVRAGELGRVLYLSSQRLSLGRVRTDCDVLWSLAPHDVAIVLHLLGDIPVEVSARGAGVLARGLDDVAFLTLAFPDGAVAGIHVSWLDPVKVRRLTVVGDRRTVVFDDVAPDRKLTIVDTGVSRLPEFGRYDTMGEFQSTTSAGEISVPELPSTEPLRTEVEAFATAIRTGIAPLTDLAHGLEVVRVLAAAEASMRRGGTPVEVAGGDVAAPAVGDTFAALPD